MPTTRVAVFDCEGLTVDMRWDKQLPVYCVVFLTVEDDGSKHLYRLTDVDKAILFAQRLIDAGYLLVAHNAKFDYGVLKCRGLQHMITPERLSVACTQTMAYIQDSTQQSYSLAQLTGEKDDVIRLLIDKGIYTGEYKSFWSVDHSNSPVILAHILDYCVTDCKATLRLYMKQAQWFNEHSQFIKPLREIEFPMIEVLQMVEARGSTIDEAALDTLTGDLNKAIEEAKDTIERTYYLLPELQWHEEKQTYIPKEKIYKGGKHTNKRSNVSYYLDRDCSIVCSDSATVYDHCKLVPYNSAAATGHTWWLLKRTAPELLELADETQTGKPQLNKAYFESVAEQMPDSLPIAKLIKLQKLYGFCESTAKFMQTTDGRIHPSYQSTRTRTTRLSCTNPNLQQIPRPTGGEPALDYGMRLRSLFVPETSNVLLCADLDRIEIVVLAWYLAKVMKDTSLQDAVNRGDDVHQFNADLWNTLRVVAKTLIFLLVYGGGPGLIHKRGLAKSLAEAEAMFAGVHKSQPAIQKLKELVYKTIVKRGYLTNPFGAHQLYPELESKRRDIRSRGERQSFNCLIQKTARDIYNTLLIASMPTVLKYNGYMVNLVHDEVVIEFPQEYAEVAKLELNAIWQKRYDILPGIMINGDWNIGQTWYEAK